MLFIVDILWKFSKNETGLFQSRTSNDCISVSSCFWVNLMHFVVRLFHSYSHQDPIRSKWMGFHYTEKLLPILFSFPSQINISSLQVVPNSLLVSSQLLLISSSISNYYQFPPNWFPVPLISINRCLPNFLLNLFSMTNSITHSFIPVTSTISSNSLYNCFHKFFSAISQYLLSFY